MEERPVLTLEEFEEKLKAEERPVFKKRTLEELRPFIEKANELKKSIRLSYCLIKRAYLSNFTLEIDLFFHDCCFLSKSYFRRSQFTGTAYFHGTTFSKRAHFTKTKFLKRTTFAKSKFSGFASFSNTQFSGIADFNATEFSNVLRFRGAKFLDEAFFHKAIMSGNADFQDVTFFGNVHFGGAKFFEGVGFVGTTFSRDAVFNVTEVKYLDLYYATIEKRFNMDEIDPANFGTLKVYQALINGLLFLPKNLLVYEGKSKLKSELDGDYETAREEYGLLYDNYKRIPHYEAEQDHAYYKFREMDRKARWKEIREVPFKDWKIRQWWDALMVSGNWLFKQLCFGYGVRLKNIVFTALAAIFSFSVFYYFSARGIVTKSGKSLLELYGGSKLVLYQKSLYFSGITFATIGYGDLSPDRWWLQLLCMGEGLLGVSLVALFIVAFGRKLLR